jgi:hypothetical protein
MSIVNSVAFLIDHANHPIVKILMGTIVLASLALYPENKIALPAPISGVLASLSIIAGGLSLFCQNPEEINVVPQSRPGGPNPLGRQGCAGG